MATVVTIAVLLIAAAVLLFVVRARTRDGGGRRLKRRFGPEYERALARHEGDVQAAERELGERVKRHGSLKEKPLPPEARQRHMAQWADIQEQFVESPHKAVAEADALLSRLATDRGFPDGEQFEEQMAALSVHHAQHVHGYRSMHTARRSQSDTEDMRKAMLEARGLFEALVAKHSADSDRRRPQPPDNRGHAPRASNRRHAKGSGTE